ncbi:MAG: DUF4142 domain-containing protein [Verrucomicrobiota bacterium]
MKTPVILALCSAAFISGATLPVFAETESKGRSSQPGQVGAMENEKMFIQKAGPAGMAEVELAQAATKKGTSEHVKTVAAQLVTDHTKANTELAELAKAKGVPIPAPTEKEKKMHDAVLKKSGAEFDAAFLDAMSMCHKKDIALFEKASRELKDPDLKAFVDKTLPVLKSHAEMIAAPVSKN